MESSSICYITLSSVRIAEVGGILFGIAFFMTALRIRNNELQLFLMVSGIGIMLLFGSLIIHGLIFLLSPPFGIIAISYLGLASYLLLIGLFTASKQLSRDALIRKELNQIAGEQMSLLKNIGAAELERNLIKRIRPIMDKTKLTEDTTPQYYDEEDYKLMIKEVLTELKAHQNL